MGGKYISYVSRGIWLKYLPALEKSSPQDLGWKPLGDQWSGMASHKSQMCFTKRGAYHIWPKKYKINCKISAEI